MKNPILYTSAFLLTGAAALITGCRNNTVAQPAPIVDGNAAASDPTSANLLPVAATQQYAPQYVAGAPAAPRARVAGTQYAAVPQSSTESYPPQAAPNYGTGNSQQNEAYQYNTQQPQYQQPQPYGEAAAPISAQEYDQYSDLLDSNVPAATQPPPPLPVDYEQPEAPGPDYLWTPGYWDYASAGYYYVPGTWVSAPYQGALWTPGWWGYGGDRYHWHHGYWGRHVGYYGGVNYGFGFIGFGYQGGYWNGDHFFYNRAVNRVNASTVNNYVYERRVSVVNNTYINNTRTSYYGGPGGLNRGPSQQEFAAQREQRTPPMQAQIANRQAAAQNRQQFFNTNNGRPAMLAVSRPLQADRNIAAPPRTVPGGSFANGQPGGFQPNGGFNGNNAAQRQQFEQQQRVQMEQQRQQQAQQQNLQRQQGEQQRLQQQQTNLQQRQQIDAQRQQLNTQHQQQEQANFQQRQQLDLQHQQQVQANTQRQQLQDQQRTQQTQQRQVEQQQRQQADAQRQQQVNAQQQASQQQRQQVEVQRQQADAVRQQQATANAQREQQAQQQRVQMDTQRVQQQQQNIQRQQQMMQQREQSVRPAAAAAPRMAPPAPHAEAPHAAPPHMEAPHAAPAPQAPQQHGEHH